MPQFILFLAMAYLSGSVSPSYFFGWLLKGDDLRKFGSGNLGMTNATRVLGKWVGVAVLVVDVLKGALPVLLLPLALSEELLGGRLNVQLLFGLAAVLGHCFPFYLGWKGGKGVLTGLGVFLVIAPGPLLIGFAVGFGLIVALRYVSIGSMLGAASFAVATFFLRREEPALIGAAVATALFVVFTHRQNVVRLAKGEEHKLGSGRKSKAENGAEESGSSA
jgi:glycerol-3-phosphate acyltransferase PlsY